MFQLLHTFLLLLLRLWNAIRRLGGRARQTVAPRVPVVLAQCAFSMAAFVQRLSDRPREALTGCPCAQWYSGELNSNIAWRKFRVPLQTVVVSVASPHRTHLQRRTLV